MDFILITIALLTAFLNIFNIWNNLYGKLTGKVLPVQYAGRRPGDPPILVADHSAIKAELGWEPHYSDPDTILNSAWNWHRSHPHGFKHSSEHFRLLMA